MTSPYEFYQYWVNVPDADVKQFFLRFTFLPVAEINELCAAKDQRINDAKRRLAVEITTLVHGAEAAQDSGGARQRAAFEGGRARRPLGRAFRRGPARRACEKGSASWTCLSAPRSAPQRATRAASSARAGRTWAGRTSRTSTR